MFGIGFSEILMIAIVGLIVLGPEKLPKAARLVGMILGKGRRQWQSMKDELNLELYQEQMRKQVEDVRQTLTMEHAAIMASLDPSEMAGSPGALPAIASTPPGSDDDAGDAAPQGSAGMRVEQEEGEHEPMPEELPLASSREMLEEDDDYSPDQDDDDAPVDAAGRDGHYTGKP